MSSVVTCPKCRKAVSMPAEAELDAWVRCPLCLAKFQLDAIPNKAPPMLELIGEPAEAGFAALTEDADEAETSFDPMMEETDAEFSHEAPPISSAAFAAVSSTTADLGEDEDTLPAMEAGSLAPAGKVFDYRATHGFREASDDDSDVLQLEPEQVERAAPPVTDPTDEVPTKAPRRRKKVKRNPIVGALKHAGAAVLGLALGYAVLFYGFNKDLLDLAPLLPSALVPTSLQSPQQTSLVPAPPQNFNPPAPDSGGEATNPPDETAPMGTAGDPPPMSDSPVPDNPMTGTPMTETPTTETPATETPMPEPPMTDSPAPTPMPETPMLDSNDGALPGVGTTPPMPMPMPMPEPTPTPMPTDPPPSDPPASDPPPSDPPATNPPATETIPPVAPPDTAPPMADSPMPPAGESPAPMPMPDPSAPPDNLTPAPTPMPEPTNPPSDFPPPPAPMPMPETSGVGPKSDKKFTLDEVNQAIAAAHQSAQALQTAPADLASAERTKERTKLAVAYFKNFATLGEVLTLVDDEPENAKAARAAALTALQQVANDMPKLNQIGKYAGYWIKRPDRSTNGIVLTGRVQETTPVGKLFRSKLLMLGHDQPAEAEILIVTAEEPAVKQGEVAVLLGMIVGAPSINLHDYEGSEDSVIWASVIGPAQLESSP